MLPPIQLRNLGLLLSIVLLSACGESLKITTPDGWSPAVTPPVEPTEPTEPTEPVEPRETDPIKLGELIKAGQEQYSKNCAVCHGEEGEGSLFVLDDTKQYYPALLGSAEAVANPNATYTLSDYISTFMPTSGAKCDGDCAEQVTAYIRTWADEAVIPAPVVPTPVNPTPVEPTPVEPTPVEPTPVEPTPVEPTPVEPTPVEPTPVEPTPVEPTPVEPTPVDPVTEPVDPVTGDVVNGKALYTDLGCSLCHGSTGTSLIGQPDIDSTKTILMHSSLPDTTYTLTDYIQTWMPLGAEGSCDAQCGDDIAAYILSWEVEETTNVAPPVVVVMSDLTSGETPLTILFDALASTENEDNTLTYLWAFSDGTSSNLSAPTKTFNTAGNYTATLTVTDTDNVSTTADAINITATSPQVDLAPVAVITKNVSSGEVPLNIDFNASNSSDDNSIDSYRWNFGDGSATDLGLVVSHTYETEGVYTATLTVIDDKGQSTQTETEITVEAVIDLKPVAAFTINATSGEAPFAANFDASGSSDDNEITTYSWNFGNSAGIENGVTSSYTFTDAGVYTVTLTVTDSNNQSDSVTQNVTVTSVIEPVTEPVTPDPVTPDPVTPDPVTPDPVTPDPVTPDPVALIGNADNGEVAYGEYGCASCHGETGTAPISFFPDIVPSKATLTHSSAPGVTYTLANYIETWMPQGPGSVNCGAQCGADIASYIATWETDTETEPEVFATCDIDEIQYGRRQMRLLTSREYENSLKDLLGYEVDAINVGIPSDTLVEDFANQALTAVTQDYMDAYTSVATAAANYAFENNFAGVASCTGSSLSQCADIFIDDFAVRAYRRPLTNDEADRYRAIFTGSLSAGSNNEALKIAVQAAVSSPYFLYRSEMGRSIADIEESNENREGNLVSGSDSYTLAGSNLSSALNGTNVDGFTDFGLHSYQGFNLNDYNFTGNDIVTVVAKGVEANGSLPTLYLKVGEYVSRQQLSSTNENSYTFALSGDEAVNGSNKYIQFANVPNDVTNEQGGTLSIQSITIANAVIAQEPIVELNELLDSDAYVLTAYEVATFIAYTYTGSTPDATLLQAAKNGELSTQAEIKTHITRLMATDKAREHFGEFAAEWLDVDGVLSSSKDAALFPTFTQDVREDMAQEVRDIFMHVMFDENQDIKNIYSDFSFMNKNLADFYGVAGPTSDKFVKVDKLANRGGVLTSGAFMANYAHNDETSPIKRAVAVRESLLCQSVPPMPTNLANERDAAQSALADFIAENDNLITNAEYYGFITKNAPCSACHEAIINPHAFGMEDFDPVGLVRTEGTNGKAIDATGRLIGTATLDDGNSFDFHGARALSNQLKELPAVQTCFAEKSFRFVMATGHEVYNSDSDTSPELSDEEKSDYNCALESMTINMSKNNNNAKAAFEAIGLSSLVLYRKQQ